MKALYLEDYGHVCIKHVPVPNLKKGHALIKVKSVGVCGSDISAYRKKGVPISVPIILGHEIAGIVEEVEQCDSSGLKKGDHVIVDPYLYCGNCYPCSLGRTNCCEHLKVLGVQTDGAMSEYFVHPVKNLIKIDDDLPWDIAPIAEPLSIALHAIHRTQLSAMEKVVIIGAGPIGVLAALASKVYGALPILVDIISARLEYAKFLGIDCTINPKECDSIAKISEITNMRMAEAVIEASGSTEAVRKTLEYASYCGRIALTGWPTGETLLPTSMITKKEISIFGSRTSVGEFQESISLIKSNHINARDILTAVIPFDNLPDKIHEMSEYPEKHMKVVALLD